LLIAVFTQVANQVGNSKFGIVRKRIKFLRYGVASYASGFV